MNERDCLACPEYYQLSRRGFVKFSGATLLALGAPEWLPRVAFARDDGADATVRDVVVSVYLRGGADGLTLCVPYGDPAYATRRILAPTNSPNEGTRILPPDGTIATAQVLSNSTMFGLPPAMADLVGAYEAGKMAIIHTCGWKVTNPSRSHFDAQRWMELGQFNPQALFTGWLGRHLANTGAIDPSSVFRSIGIANGLQPQLVGGPKGIPVPGLAGSSAPNFNLGGSGTTVNARKASLSNMYNAVADPMRTAAQITNQTIDVLNTMGFSSYQTQGGTPYPTTSLGYSMKSAAALIKNPLAIPNATVEAIAIDKGGWDTHSLQGVNPGGSMYNTMLDLARSLRAFYEDVVVASPRRVVVVVMSEFGRRVQETLSFGTDHGFGNVMFVMGHRIAGRQVISYSDTAGTIPGWPGVGAGQLFQNLDLKVTVDYRDVLGEICQNLLDDPNLSGPTGVFPGYVPVFRGVTAP